MADHPVEAGKKAPKGPQTQAELEATTFFKAGFAAKGRGESLAKSIAMLRPGTWQYDAFVEGYDAPRRPAKKPAGEPV